MLLNFHVRHLGHRGHDNLSQVTREIWPLFATPHLFFTSQNPKERGPQKRQALNVFYPSHVNKPSTEPNENSMQPQVH